MKNFVGSSALPNLVYHRPTHMKEALSLLNTIKGELKIIAGCTDIIPAIRRGKWSFADGLHMVDIKRIKKLNSVTREGDTIRIGAATRLSDIERSPLIREHAPILADAVSEMASLQVRNTGTIGGNLCTASPAADCAPPLLVLDTKVKVKGIYNEKLVPLAEFFIGPGKTILGPKEILAEIQFSVMNSHGKSCWIKMGRRNGFTFSVVSVATLIKARDGFFDDVRIALGAVSPTPIRALRAEKHLIGKKVNEQIIDEGAKVVQSEVKPISDVKASAEYRIDMSYILTKRAIVSCLSGRGHNACWGNKKLTSVQQQTLC